MFKLIRGFRQGDRIIARLFTLAHVVVSAPDHRQGGAILPLRGKVLNAQQAPIKKVLANEELSNIVTALGCGMGADFRADRLRYGRIILLMDADSDGHHISTLHALGGATV